MDPLIKKIIEEELAAALSGLKEMKLTSVDYEQLVSKDNPKDNIIYNYEKGREFATNSLESDINNLNRYHLVEYLPKSISEERWGFELETVYGSTLMIDIERKVRGGKSFWTLRFGHLYKGEKNPELIGEVVDVEQYDAFVDMVNKTLSAKIDPSKY